MTRLPPSQPFPRFPHSARSRLWLLISAALAQTALAAESGNKASNEPAADKGAEVIQVTGDRRMPETEVTEKTRMLLDTAGNMGDPLNAVYSLPGVIYAGSDFGGEPAIRGSSPDDNAFLIDHLPARYIYHLFGDSIFNEHVVGDFRMLPASFGGQYGNVTGGVMDVRLRDPRRQDLKTIVDTSFLKAGVFVESALGEQGAFYFSYRRGLAEFFLPEDEELDDDVHVTAAPASDDYQGKAQWLLGERQRLSLTLAGASDDGAINIGATSELGRLDPDAVGKASDERRFDSAGLTWEWFGDAGHYARITAGSQTGYQDLRYGSTQTLNADFDEQNLRGLWQMPVGDAHRLDLGVDVQAHRMDYRFDFIPYFCTDHDPDCEDRKGERIRGLDRQDNDTQAVYLIDRWQLGRRFSTEIGLRAEQFSVSDQRFILPRLRFDWQLSDQLDLRLGAGRYSRQPDLDKALPLWGNPKLKAAEADHLSLGAAWRINERWRADIELYDKQLSKLPVSLTPEEDAAGLHYLNGLDGNARGVELLVERLKEGGWSGWASLSWAKSDRTDTRSGLTKPYYLDTPLIANLVANKDLSEKWRLGVRFTARSGARYTPVIGIHRNPDHPDSYLPTYGELNSRKLPAYYRLDIQAEYKMTTWGRPSSLSFGLLNATNQENVSGYYFKPDGKETPENFRIGKEVGIGIFPYVGFKMQF